MPDAKKEAKRAYLRRYNQQHREKKSADHKVWREANRESIAAKKKAYYEKNKASISADRKAQRLISPERYSDAAKEKRSARARLRNSGFTTDVYKMARAIQQDKCGICRQDLLALNPTRVHADHDHATGHPRGVLCNNCNMAMGLLGDSISTLRAAIAYLTNPPLGFL